jgi:hypothetical protein
MPTSELFLSITYGVVVILAFIIGYFIGEKRGFNDGIDLGN